MKVHIDCQTFVPFNPLGYPVVTAYDSVTATDIISMIHTGVGERKVRLINFIPSPVPSNPAMRKDFVADLPKVNISMEQMMSCLVNSPSWKPALQHSLEAHCTGPERIVFEDAILSWIFENCVDPSSYNIQLIYFTKGPRSSPVFIGFRRYNLLVLFRIAFADFLRSTPTEYWPNNFAKLYDLLSPQNPANFNTELTIGADPELVLYESEDLSPTEEEFANEAIDAAQVIGNRGTNTMVGTDGCSAIFEIRPTASKSPQELTEQIEKCLKILTYKIVTSKQVNVKQFFLEAGGGSHFSIGGHIHFGNENFINAPNYFMSRICTMLDDFLYRPIRRRMYGAVRAWLSGDLYNRWNSDSISMIERMTGAKKTLVENMATRTTDVPARSDYDRAGQMRVQRHGFEYRSLPSFIASKEFTEIVLTIAMGIGKLILTSIRDKKNINYDKPTTEAGYMLFTTQDVFKKFMRYINGEKRNLFFQNTLKGWGIQPDRYKYVSVTAAYDPNERCNARREELDEVSLQVNEAMADADICLPWTIAINVSPAIVGVEDSIGVFLSKPAMQRMVTNRPIFFNENDAHSLNRYARETSLLRDVRLHVGLGPRLGTLGTLPFQDLRRDMIIAHLVIFLENEILKKSVAQRLHLSKTIFKKFPGVQDIVDTLVTRAVPNGQGSVETLNSMSSDTASPNPPRMPFMAWEDDHTDTYEVSRIEMPSEDL